MKKLFIGVLVIAAGLTGYSFYAGAYDPIKENSINTIERRAVNMEAEIKENKENKINKAALELDSWKKLTRDEKMKLVEQKHSEKVKKSAASWAKKSSDKKLAEYEKRLKRKAISKEEKAKIAKAKLAEKCKDAGKESEHEGEDGE